MKQSLVTRLEALEARTSPPEDPPYVRVRIVNAGLEPFGTPTVEDDGVWAVRIDEHFVVPEAGETLDQICERAVALHPVSYAVPVLFVYPTAHLLNRGVPDEPVPAAPIH